MVPVHFFSFSWLLFPTHFEGRKLAQERRAFAQKRSTGDFLSRRRRLSPAASLHAARRQPLGRPHNGLFFGLSSLDGAETKSEDYQWDVWRSACPIATTALNRSQCHQG